MPTPTDESLYSPSESSTSVAGSQLPMSSESSAAVYLNQVQFMTPGPKKGGGGSSTMRQHSASTSSSTSATSPTIMSFSTNSGRGGSSQTTTTGTISAVGPTAATGTLSGAAPGSTNKRGRKPGPLSKTAREAQRRLNHSIIEKARRTKINDALATLKRLVPIDYLQTREMQKLAAADGNDNSTINEEEGEDDDFDDDDEGGDDEAPGDDSEYRELTSRTSASAPSTTKQRSAASNSKTNAAPPKAGKKQEKEKEFKLEILVRTVVFLQDLLERVGHLEAAVPSSTSSSNPDNVPEHCTACGNAMRLSPSSSSSATTTTNNNKKRKREYISLSSPTIEKDFNDAPHAHSHGNTQSRTKIARTASSSEFTTPDLEEVPPTPRFSPQRQRTVAQSPRNTASSLPSLTSSSAEKRLPSISSWLNNDSHAPILPSPHSFGTFVGSVPGKEPSGNNKFGYSPATPNVPPGSYLPSPPSTTHCFGPIRTYSSTQVPPFLNLGPGATSSSSSSRGIGTRSPPVSKSLGKSPASTSGLSAARQASTTPPALTPEDESAASMLLQIASSSSPPFRPTNAPAFSSSSSSSASSSKSKSSTTSPNFPGYHNANALPEPSQFSLYSSHPHPHAHSHSHSHPHPHSRPHPYQPQPENQRPQLQYDDRPTASVRQVETPSSILGIRKY